MSDGIRVYTGAGALPVFALILLIVVIIILIPLLLLGIVGAAFTRLGFSWITAIAVILLMLIGSFVNIPLYRVKRDMIRAPHENPAGFDIPTTVMPEGIWETEIAISLGGAIIPVCIAAYLFYRGLQITGNTILLPTLVCIAAVAAVSFVSTRILPGFGLKVSFFLPALTALLVGIILSDGQTGLSAAVIACTGGILGTLLGGNLAHLIRIREIEIPRFSIGGAGTFGAVFLCCIVPALIA